MAGWSGLQWQHLGADSALDGASRYIRRRTFDDALLISIRTVSDARASAFTRRMCHAGLQPNYADVGEHSRLRQPSVGLLQVRRFPRDNRKLFKASLHVSSVLSQRCEQALKWRKEGARGSSGGLERGQGADRRRKGMKKGRRWCAAYSRYIYM